MTALTYFVDFIDSTTGLPITGLTPVWHYCTDASGTTIGSPPSFTSVNNGRFSFPWDIYANGQMLGMVDGGVSITVGTDRYRPGSALFAAPIQAQDLGRIAAVILATPANLLVTDGTGNISVSSAQRALIAGLVWDQLVASHTVAGSFGLAAAAQSTAIATLPTAAQIAAVILATPAHLLAVDASGNISVPPAQEAAIAALVWDQLVASHTITGSFGLALAGQSTAIAALPTAAQNAAGLLDLANGVETGKTVRQALRAIGAVLAGLLSGAGTGTITIQALGNDSTTRIVAVTDATGNRTAITLNL